MQFQFRQYFGLDQEDYYTVLSPDELATELRVRTSPAHGNGANTNATCG